MSEIEARRSGSLRDVDEGLAFVNELTVEIDGNSVGEAVFGGVPLGGIGRDFNGEDIETKVLSADGGEDDCSFRVHD